MWGDPRAPIERATAEAVTRALRWDQVRCWCFFQVPPKSAAPRRCWEQIKDSTVEVVPLFGGLD
jgi:hypothetical protein